MHYFIMNMQGLTRAQVKLSLKIGANKKNIRLTEYPQARRQAYDFLEVAESLHSPWNLRSSGGYGSGFNEVATTDFANAAFFKMNYAGSILFHMQVPDADFLNSYQKSLIFDISKLDRYVSIHPVTRVQELQMLRDDLRAEMQQYLK